MRTRPLRELGVRELGPLLEEETGHWLSELLWDYSEVASAVEGGVDRRSLNGRAAQEGSKAVAYCYYLHDPQRILIGAAFASEAFRGQGIEEGLLTESVGEALAVGQRRIECQTLFTTARQPEGVFRAAGFAEAPREYLIRDCVATPLPQVEHVPGLRPLRREDLPAAAEVVRESHVDSVDAAVNLTYRSSALCKVFVETLVLRSGCGRVDPEASAVVQQGDGISAVLIASQLSRRSGHICQVSVRPEAQGQGLGRRLMAHALSAFRRRGFEAVSLSVTVGNERARALYYQMGFTLRRRFGAYAWVPPPDRIELPST